ncbi:hypothetical protein [Persicobacter sp. CCB-QB2]|uniref:hypothetical protein n=1 Tax=Persicobacter sp. CCB-QB2 TaxID=1561025 RepID=UPI0006A9CEAB|nr:hypothetical protein [Persicobacter sp. CCB-QB2]
MSILFIYLIFGFINVGEPKEATPEWLTKCEENFKIKSKPSDLYQLTLYYTDQGVLHIRCNKNNELEVVLIPRLFKVKKSLRYDKIAYKKIKIKDEELLNQIYSLLKSSDIESYTEAGFYFKYKESKSCHSYYHSRNVGKNQEFDFEKFKHLADSLYRCTEFDKHFYAFFKELPPGEYGDTYIVLGKVKKPRWYKD